MWDKKGSFGVFLKKLILACVIGVGILPGQVWSGTLICTYGDLSDQLHCIGAADAIYTNSSENAICECGGSEIGNIVYSCNDGSWHMVFSGCKCTTCNVTRSQVNSIAITGGRRLLNQVTKSCASGCVCSDCSGTVNEYVCECNTGYTVVNQGTSACSCEENIVAGTCYVYYCDPGYYVDSTGTGCLKCPNIQEQTDTESLISATTKEKNTGDIYSCYGPKGTTGYDILGTFTYTEDCYYSE